MKRILCLAAFTFAAPALAQQVDPDRMVRPYWWDKPVVEALGRSEIEVLPNRAFFAVSFVETSGTSGKAMELVVAKARLAQEAIRKVAGDKVRMTTAVSIEPFYEQYRDKDGDLYENERADKVKGYEASASIDVSLLDITFAGRSRAAALALGPQDSGEIVYRLDPTDEMLVKVYGDAVANAKAKATASATASGSKLGKTLVIQEGGGPCLGNWSSRQVARQTLGAGVGRPEDRAMAVGAMDERIVVTGARIAGKDVTITEADITRLNLESDFEPVSMSSAVCVVYELLD